MCHSLRTPRCSRICFVLNNTKTCCSVCLIYTIYCTNTCCTCKKTNSLLSGAISSRSSAGPSGAASAWPLRATAFTQTAQWDPPPLSALSATTSRGARPWAFTQTAWRTLVERFDRRGIEPFELFTSEFGQNSVKIQYILLENSKIQDFSIFSTTLAKFRRKIIKLWAKFNDHFFENG